LNSAWASAPPSILLLIVLLGGIRSCVINPDATFHTVIGQAKR
jgi:hypothetical protein